VNFEPKLPDASVNVPRVHPLADVAYLLVGVGAIVAILYVVLGFAVDYAVERMPPGLETALAARFEAERTGAVADPDLHAVAAVLDKLLPHTGELRQQYDFRVSLMANPEINAFVLPGGHIVIFRGLLDAVSSENELAMVLGHELAHCAQRDHLRGLGRGIVLAVLATALLGSDSGVSELFTGGLSLGHARFSRGQEASADLYGLELLQKTYGHVGGADAIFRQMKQNDLRWAAWIATHPLSERRIAAIGQHALQRGFRAGPTLPLALVERTAAP